MNYTASKGSNIHHDKKTVLFHKFHGNPDILIEKEVEPQIAILQRSESSSNNTEEDVESSFSDFASIELS